MAQALAVADDRDVIDGNQVADDATAGAVGEGQLDSPPCPCRAARSMKTPRGRRRRDTGREALPRSFARWCGTDMQSPMDSLTRNPESTTECRPLRQGEYMWEGCAKTGVVWPPRHSDEGSEARR